MMQAGKLRHQVDIQEGTEARDALGGVARTWSTVAIVWAAVEPLRGRELYEAQQVNAQLSHRVTLRYLGTLTTHHRLVHDGRVLNIAAVLDRDERHRTVELMATEVQ